jgi:hypothetical protein
MTEAEKKTIEAILDHALSIANDSTAYENEAFAEIATKLGALIGIEIVERDDDDEKYWEERWQKKGLNL